jgi:hypothetical protein
MSCRNPVVFWQTSQITDRIHLTQTQEKPVSDKQKDLNKNAAFNLHSLT